ncbi:MAG: CDP-archaeol synthase [Fastidiosipilaceae bacterium]|jgi:CDP-diglyceride synthetase
MAAPCSTITRMILSLFPVILTGITVMLFVKLPILDRLKRPMDRGLILRDGKRLFGDHKTWKGFLAYPFFAAIWTILLGFLAAGLPRVEAMNYLYVRHENRPLYNLCVGLLLGFAYALFELPNSFIKRRLAIDEGKMATGPLRPLFIFIDQADSVIGCVLVLALVYPMSPTFILAYILLGAGLHILLNYLLALVGLRKERR